MALSEWSDWREWPAELEAEMEDLRDRATDLLHRVIVMRHEDAQDALVPVVAALNHHARVSSSRR